MSVLVAYAHTDEGEAALHHGRRLAARDGDTVAVFDLDETTSAGDRTIQPPGPASDGPPEHWYAAASGSRNAADELVDLADQLGVAQIVVGIRRRSPLGKFVLGSNAQRIIIDARVPVLAVKAGSGDHEH